MTAAIALENITLKYADNRVLDNLSLRIEPGEIVALLGRSGSGKSSLLRTILGFETPEAGVVTLSGTIADRHGEQLMAPEERNIAVVFQDLALWPHLTVAGNLAFGLESRGVARSQRDSRIDTMLGQVELSGKKDMYPGALSGGERQRVAIARALILEPRAVVLDEPLSNLDVVLKTGLLRLFHQLLTAQGTAALFVTHNLDEAQALASRVVVMEHGRIAQSGTVGELRAHPASEFVRALTQD